MVLVNIIHICYTNSIHVPYNYYTWPFQFIFLMYIILIIHVTHKIYRTLVTKHMFAHRPNVQDIST